jgi:hypothetical protein
MTPQDTPTPQKDMKVLLQMNEQLATTNAKLERSLAAAQARVQALSVGVGNIIWMTGGEASREQLQNIRNYATNLLDPPVAPQEGERDD